MDYELVEKEMRRILSSSTQEGYKEWTTFEYEKGTPVFFALVKEVETVRGSRRVTDIRFVDFRSWVRERTNNRPVILNHKLHNAEYIHELPKDLAPITFYRVVSLNEDFLPENLARLYFAEYVRTQPLPPPLRQEISAIFGTNYW